MHNTHRRELQFHRTQNGREPFTEWFESIRDQKTRTRIRGRLDRLESGNFGDCQSVGNGIFELRRHSSEKVPYLDTFATILNALECRLTIAPLKADKHAISDTEPVAEVESKKFGDSQTQLTKSDAPQ